MPDLTFYFQGQSLTAKLKNDFIYKIYLTGEDIELNLTDDIVRAFSIAKKLKANN